MSAADPQAEAGRSRWRLPLERELRLWAGIILFAFVAMHLANHALGVFGLRVMEAAQIWRGYIWESVPGQVALYGALLVHAGLALRRLTRRRIARMPLEDMVQIGLGIAIPYLLLTHVLGTRVFATYGYEPTYTNVLLHIWEGSPIKQVLLLICVWVHGCIGINQAIRGLSWYGRGRDGFLLGGVLVPCLALAGFFAASREALALNEPAETISRENYLAVVALNNWLEMGIMAVMALVASIILGRMLVRMRAGTVSVRYIGHGSFNIPVGTTILEASRNHRIPHPSQCGGRGRCSTCRIVVTSKSGRLPAPNATELAMLERISAPANVRLGCQFRPNSDVSVQILLPTMAIGAKGRSGDDAYRWGAERDVAVLFVDIRAFNVLTRLQIPYDLVVLMNRFMQEMSQATEAHGGQADAFSADGLIAIFGLDPSAGNGAANAIRAAQAMLTTVAALNREFGSALPIPLRVGIGVHYGPAVVARVGDPDRGMRLIAMGDTITVAGRLENATKDYLADCLLSEEVVQKSGLAMQRLGGKNLHVNGRDKPIVLYTLEGAPVAPRPVPVAGEAG